ncbi:putative SP-containing protein [Vairimorpha necatrix]|uniref:SP-containing protein n=1 Tax=Vairimorpha necatrix TaxID=6039 RepID=A0AAX4JD43_9MICR
MYLLLTLIIHISASGQYGTNNTTPFTESVIDALCNDQKQRELIQCQPSYTTNVRPIAWTTPPVQNQNIVPSNTTQFVSTPVNPVQNIAPIPTAPPVIQPAYVPRPVPPQNTTVTLSSTPIPNLHLTGTGAGAKLSAVLSENPLAKTQLINFLEYNGVPPPWDQLLDFETTQHHQLPDPDNLFRKIRKQLLTFENVKTCIVEGLIVVEKYINRGKAYLAEDLKDLCRDKTVLKNILKRLKTKPAYEFRSELFKRYAEVKSRSFATQKSFYKLRDWLMKIKRLFATL